jgi:hypothetical protein
MRRLCAMCLLLARMPSYTRTDRHILPTKCYLQCASQGAVSVHIDAKLWGL